jgi:hypothetical protein
VSGKRRRIADHTKILIALLREHRKQKKLPKALRIAPFLGFLDSKIAKEEENIPDYGPIRA